MVAVPIVYPIAASVSDSPTPGASLTPHKAVLAPLPLRLLPWPGEAFLDATAARIASRPPSHTSATFLTNSLWAWTRLGYTPDRSAEPSVRPTFYVLNPGAGVGGCFCN